MHIYIPIIGMLQVLGIYAIVCWVGLLLLRNLYMRPMVKRHPYSRATKVWNGGGFPNMWRSTINWDFLQFPLVIWEAIQAHKKGMWEYNQFLDPDYHKSLNLQTATMPSIVSEPTEKESWDTEQGKVDFTEGRQLGSPFTRSDGN